MRHHNIYCILLLVLTSLNFSSCKKWLDVQPSTQLPNNELFKNEVGFNQALTGVYTGLSSPSLYGREMTYGTMDVLAGYYIPINVFKGTYFKIYNNYPYKRDNPAKDDAAVDIVDAMWTGMFKQVANLNNIIQEIDARKSVFSGDNYNIIKGEAIGLRAFIHLDLLRMYGPAYVSGAGTKAIPFVDTLSSLVSPLLTVEQASDRIILDLKKALSLMNNDPIKTGTAPNVILGSPVATPTLAAYHNRRYHFNYYAVTAALARIYLWKGDKLNALKYAKEVIATQATRFPWVLDANLSAITSTSAPNKDRTFTTEHIFALNIKALEETVPPYMAASGSDESLVLSMPEKTKDNIYETNSVDPRNQYLFVSYNSNFLSTKLYQDPIVSIWFKHQMPLISVSEMYYIAAECEPLATDGVKWLNIIRQARTLPSLTGISTDVVLQREIQKEYQKEFLGLGQLWFYYKRKNMDVLPYTQHFKNVSWYTFDMPEVEYVYGGRQ